MSPASCFTLPKWLKQYGGHGGGDAPRGSGEAAAAAKEAQRGSEGGSERGSEGVRVPTAELAERRSDPREGFHSSVPGSCSRGLIAIDSNEAP